MYQSDCNAHQSKICSSASFSLMSCARQRILAPSASGVFAEHCFRLAVPECQYSQNQHLTTHLPASNILHPLHPNLRSLLIQILPLIHLFLHAYRRQQQQSSHRINYIAFPHCSSEDDFVVVAPDCGCPKPLVRAWPPTASPKQRAPTMTAPGPSQTRHHRTCQSSRLRCRCCTAARTASTPARSCTAATLTGATPRAPTSRCKAARQRGGARG